MGENTFNDSSQCVKKGSKIDVKVKNLIKHRYKTEGWNSDLDKLKAMFCSWFLEDL